MKALENGGGISDESDFDQEHGAMGRVASGKAARQGRSRRGEGGFASSSDDDGSGEDGAGGRKDGKGAARTRAAAQKEKKKGGKAGVSTL